MSNVFSNIKVFPLKKSHPSIVANGSVLVAGVVEVKFTVLKGSNGIFAKFPAKKGAKPDENGKDVWYPEVKIVNEDLFKEFQSLVQNELKKSSGAGGSQVTKNAKKAGEENQTEYTDGIPF
jgi:DNA-binding cell septation regulator SpoVG